MGNALAIYEKIQDPVRYCTDDKLMLAVASMTGCSPTQAPAVMMVCLCDGITVMDYLRNYHPIDGRPTKQTQAAVADFLARGGKQVVKEFSHERSVIVFTDREGNESTWTLTIQEAEEAGWPWDKSGKEYKHNWGSTVKRADMLYYRNASRALKKIDPGIFAGLPTYEEAIDELKVVDTQITNSDGSKVSAVELAKMAAAAAEEPQAAEEIEDAKFEPAAEAAAALADATEEATSDEDERYSSRAQREAIEQTSKLLIDAGKLPPDAIAKALAKRGVQSLRSLKREDAQEILDKLISKKRELHGDSEGN